MESIESISSLIELLPTEVVRRIVHPENLIEIILDLGRPLELRYNDGDSVIHDYIISQNQINFVCKQLGEFGPDNRVGVDGTLHRISRILNRHNETIGLTCRIGKPFYGSVDLIKDILDRGLSVLILGKPGRGKTTRLRDSARYLSTDCNKRVVIVDTSNEIAGDGNIPHSAVGRSRRLQVPLGKTQHLLMIEAVENHTPEVVIIDEISTVQEAEAARSIAQRGVQLLATAHGNELEDILNNPPLASLVGGVNIVTLSDELAKQRGLNSKTVLERKHDPTFDVIVEIIDYNTIAVHPSTTDAVDAMLSGGYCQPEKRVNVNSEVVVTSPAKAGLPLPFNTTKPSHERSNRRK